jgi:hypothetical protein
MQTTAATSKSDQMVRLQTAVTEYKEQQGERVNRETIRLALEIIATGKISRGKYPDSFIVTDPDGDRYFVHRSINECSCGSKKPGLHCRHWLAAHLGAYTVGFPWRITDLFHTLWPASLEELHNMKSIWPLAEAPNSAYDYTPTPCCKTGSVGDGIAAYCWRCGRFQHLYDS